MAEVGLHLLQTPQVTLLHTLQDWTESELLGHLTIMDNLPPSSPPLFCLRMNEETTLHAQTVMVDGDTDNALVFQHVWK